MRRGRALRHPDRSAPRLGSRFAVGTGHLCQTKFWLMHLCGAGRFRLTPVPHARSTLLIPPGDLLVVHGPSLPPPSLRECCHRGLARRLVAVRRPAVLVLAKGERPQPWLADRRGGRLHDSADDDAIADHIEVVVVPLAGSTGGRGALEGQIVLVHFTEPTCAASLDHLVGAGEKGRWHSEADRPGSLQVDDELELGGLQDREVRRFLALEDAAGIDTNLAVPVHITRSVAHQPAGFDILANGIDRGYRMTGRERRQLDAPADKEPVAGNEECVGPVSQEGGEGRLDLFACAGFEELCLKSDGACSVRYRA